jgi:hypothetical protein
MGIDNYNHAYGSPVVSLEQKNMLRMANFTVCGISVCQHMVDNTFVLDDSDMPLPSLPDQKVTLAAFIRPLLNQIAQAIATMTDFCYWPLARVVRDEVGAVPLRPENKQPNPHSRGRKLYKPWFVSGRNCASNIGILHVFTNLYNEYQHLHGQEKYGYFKADVSIYLKFIQIVYSEYCPYNRNRLFLCPILEYFHPFKHAAESVWQEDRFFRCFIAPFLHTFVPHSGIRWASKLQLVSLFYISYF